MRSSPSLGEATACSSSSCTTRRRSASSSCASTSWRCGRAVGWRCGCRGRADGRGRAARAGPSPWAAAGLRGAAATRPRNSRGPAAHLQLPLPRQLPQDAPDAVGPRPLRGGARTGRAPPRSARGVSRAAPRPCLRPSKCAVALAPSQRPGHPPGAAAPPAASRRRRAAHRRTARRRRRAPPYPRPRDHAAPIRTPRRLSLGGAGAPGVSEDAADAIAAPLLAPPPTCARVRGQAGLRVDSGLDEGVQGLQDCGAAPRRGAGRCAAAARTDRRRHGWFKKRARVRVGARVCVGGVAGAPRMRSPRAGRPTAGSCAAEDLLPTRRGGGAPSGPGAEAAARHPLAPHAPPLPPRPLACAPARVPLLPGCWAPHAPRAAFFGSWVGSAAAAAAPPPPASGAAPTGAAARHGPYLRRQRGSGIHPHTESSQTPPHPFRSPHAPPRPRARARRPASARAARETAIRPPDSAARPARRRAVRT
jgi:hypothetical protein